ncbi:helix-turn-helix transcriptional regulator [Alicyclobacillus hesperidum]|uniref:helix-turn-helix transcriptional regulator n=1 Tax=Alicyclobacillus hesperidum TaxID=89784 RepID=UPI00058FA093|nr:helix-turn-helix transcriptional regulator [Alicyclobacillus hesperidum]KRW90623.1 XRE family transcriptional regulator [Alicyclobacillus tengchongensis]
MKETIARRLIELRAEKSREEVAQAIGISVSALQMYENAKRIPRDHIKIKLANYYGVSVQVLFYDYSSSHITS